MRTLWISGAVGTLLILSNPVLAGGAVQVSEPGTLALLAIGVAAAIIGRRFYRKK